MESGAVSAAWKTWWLEMAPMDPCGLLGLSVHGRVHGRWLPVARVPLICGVCECDSSCARCNSVPVKTIQKSWKMMGHRKLSQMIHGITTRFTRPPNPVHLPSHHTNSLPSQASSPGRPKKPGSGFDKPGPSCEAAALERLDDMGEAALGGSTAPRHSTSAPLVGRLDKALKVQMRDEKGVFHPAAMLQRAGAKPEPDLSRKKSPAWVL
ncbi:hypothetical protein JB92DRAFT_1117254 [Gautieria morchelliformis]|nr:hypothetical protein JB92DRAFT_1117254 [Gautieria morchelliformis]